MCRIMFRALVIVCAAAVLAVHIAHADSRWITLDGTSGSERPVVEVIHSRADETIIRFAISGFLCEDIMEEAGGFQSLRFPACGTTMDVGRPRLPMITEILAIPGRSDVKAHVIDCSTVTLKGYRVAPFQEQLPGRELKTTFDFDRRFYGTDIVYPEAIVTLGKPGIWRDLRVVPLMVHPVRYNPALDVITVCTELTVKVEYSGNSTANVKERSARPVKANYDKIYRSLVLNYDLLGIDVESDDFDAGLLMDDGYDYLIIAPDAYIDNLAPFAALKESLGLETSIVPISQIGNDAESIKNYITNEYDNNGIEYVLLAGNHGHIAGYEDYHCFSDYYYSLVEGDDDYPDIAVGRFSVSNESQIDNLVDKCISYETDISDLELTDNVLLIAHLENAPEEGSFQWVKEGIRNGSYSILYPEFTTAYGASRQDEGDRARNSTVVRSIDRGQRVVNYCGHGLEYCWGERWNYDQETFSTDWVDSLSNDTMIPVVFSIACLTNDITYDDYPGAICLGEAFTRSAEGAVAFLGATWETLGSVNASYDSKIFSLLFDEGVSRIGDASNAAAVYTIIYHGSYGLSNARSYLWLGDPSLDVIYSQANPPATPILVSPQDGEEFFTPPTPRYVTFEWEDLPTADYYQITVDTDTNFINPVFDRDDLTSSRAKTSFDIGTYYWRVRGANDSGWGSWSDVWHFDVVKRSSPFPPSVSGQSAPTRSRLIGNYPNPFNPVTEIRYDLHESVHVTITIFDVNGRHVSTLVDCKKEAGNHRVIWNGMGSDGHMACSGLYFCQIRAGNVVESKKVILLR